ncbi:MAG: DUF3276 family protein [bacterium]
MAVVTAGKRTYFLDVKTAKNGGKYLTIREATEGDNPDKKTSHRIMVFEEKFKDFSNAVEEVKKELNK